MKPLLKHLFVVALQAAVSATLLSASPLTPLPGSWHAFEKSHQEPHKHPQQKSGEVARAKVFLRGDEGGSKTGKHVNGSGSDLLSDNHWNRLVVVPEYKLLFCGIDHNYFKNFTSYFNQLRQTVTHEPGSTDRFSNAPGKLHFNKQDIEKIFRDSTWHKAVFVRDPVERFLSAVLERCASDPKMCSDPTDPSQPMSLTSAVVSALQEFAATRGRVDDRSLDWQANYCGGLGKVIDYYNTVEMAKPATLRGRVEAMLTKVGVKNLAATGFNKYFPDLKRQCPDCSPSLGTLFQGEAPSLESVVPFFPEASAWVSFEHRPESSHLVANDRVVAILLKLFKDDYDLLGMKKPEWALRIIEDGSKARAQRHQRSVHRPSQTHQRSSEDGGLPVRGAGHNPTAQQARTQDEAALQQRRREREEAESRKQEEAMLEQRRWEAAHEVAVEQRRRERERAVQAEARRKEAEQKRREREAAAQAAAEPPQEEADGDDDYDDAVDRDLGMLEDKMEDYIAHSLKESAAAARAHQREAHTTGQKLSSKRKWERDPVMRPALDVLVDEATASAEYPAFPPTALLHPAKAASFYKAHDRLNEPEDVGDHHPVLSVINDEDLRSSHPALDSFSDDMAARTAYAVADLMNEDYSAEDMLHEMASVAPVATHLLKGHGAHSMSQVDKLSLA